MVTLDDVKQARQRVSPYIRSTPLLHPQFFLNPLHIPYDLYLKVETLQITGAFKVRGALNKMLSVPDLHLGVVAVSGGNHGLAVAYGARTLGIPATTFLPLSTPQYRIDKIKAWGAEVILEGETVDDCYEDAKALCKKTGATFIHPFGDPLVIAGQGTIALEILEAAPDLDALVIAIGGGGLISGMSVAAKTINPKIKIIGVEPYGAATLYESLKAGYPITLDKITTKAGTLAAAHTLDLNFDIVKHYVDDVVLVSDDDMRHACQWLFKETAIGAELSGAAALAALTLGKIHLPSNSKVCVLICGAGTDFL